MTHPSRRLPGIFVTGTDTGVGKTRVVCWLARLLTEQGMRVGVCKPAVTGATATDAGWVWDDLQRLRAAIGEDADPHLGERICPFRWFAPLAPPAAAGYDEQAYQQQVVPYARGQVTLDELLGALDEWTGKCDCLITEGIGGLLCPLTAEETVADLAALWGRPLLVVSHLGLGTLNHTLMTVECARHRGLDVLGVLLNETLRSAAGPAEESNPQQLRQRLGIPVWGPIRYQEENEIPPVLRDIDWNQYL